MLSALQAGSRGTQACINAASTVSGIIGDLDTTIMVRERLRETRVAGEQGQHVQDGEGEVEGHEGDGTDEVLVRDVIRRFSGWRKLDDVLTTYWVVGSAGCLLV